MGVQSKCLALLGAAWHRRLLLGTATHICANFATCSWEPLTMLNPHFVAGEHGLFGGHKSEDIRTFFQVNFFHRNDKACCFVIQLPSTNILNSLHFFY